MKYLITSLLGLAIIVSGQLFSAPNPDQITIPKGAYSFSMGYATTDSDSAGAVGFGYGLNDFQEVGFSYATSSNDLDSFQFSLANKFKIFKKAHAFAQFSLLFAEYTDYESDSTPFTNHQKTLSSTFGAFLPITDNLRFFANHSIILDNALDPTSTGFQYSFKHGYVRPYLSFNDDNTSYVFEVAFLNSILKTIR